MNHIFSKVRTKHVITALVLFFVFYGGYAYFFKKPATTTTGNYRIVTVKRSDVRQTIKALGKTTVVNEQQIRFNQLGKVSVVNVGQGDTVKKDQIIAELDQTDLKNTVKQSRINYENSKLALEKLQQWNDTSQILKAEGDLLSAKNALDQARNDLSNLQSASASKIETLKNAVTEQALIYENSQKSGVNTIQSNQDALDQSRKDLEDKDRLLAIAKRDLENAKIQNVQSLDQAKSNFFLKQNTAFQDIRNALIEADTTMTDLDSMMGFTDLNRYKSATYSVYLGAKDASTKSSSQNYFDQALSAKKALTDSFNTIKDEDPDNIGTDTLTKNLDLAHDLLSVLVNLTDASYRVLTNSITSGGLTDTQLNSFESDVNSRRSSAQSRLSTITNDRASIQGLETPDEAKIRLDIDIEKKSQAVDSAQMNRDKAQSAYNLTSSGLDVKNTDSDISVLRWGNTLANAKKDLADATSSSEAEIAAGKDNVDQKQKQVEIAQAALSEIKRGATAIDLAKAKNDVEQKLLQLEQDEKSIEKYRIIAPFDGTIQNIDFKVADNLVADDTKYVYIQNPNLIRVDVLLDQVDIVKVRRGMPVTMNFYAYPNQIFSGSVSEIIGLPVVSNGVTSYEAEIILDSQGKIFYSGMTQNVEIVLSEKKNVPTLPSAAIQSNPRGKFVMIESGSGTPERRNIVTGITDGNITEIVSGVQVGEKVLERMFATSGGSGSTSGNSVRLPGLWGGGGGGGNFRGGGGGGN